MENVKCNSCGNESPREMAQCQHCGAPLFNEEEITSSEVFEIKERSTFTTFYLWLGLVLNSILGLAYFLTIFTRRGLWSAYDPMFTRIYGFISSAILVYGYLSLLRWKKMGFYILVLVAGISVVMNTILGGSISLSTFFPIAALALLYCILQIRKNGKSCWSLLS